MLPSEFIINETKQEGGLKLTAPNSSVQKINGLTNVKNAAVLCSLFRQNNSFLCHHTTIPDLLLFKLSLRNIEYQPLFKYTYRSFVVSKQI